MAQRKTQAPRWADTPAGVAAYGAARQSAQDRANLTGFDHGISCNELFREWHFWMLPRRENRFGTDANCEVVSPERLDRCKPGHGPCK